jgi:hypothetical protein
MLLAWLWLVASAFTTCPSADQSTLSTYLRHSRALFDEKKPKQPEMSLYEDDKK